jgi:hypothetical protein
MVLPDIVVPKAREIGPKLKATLQNLQKEVKILSELMLESLRMA